MAFHVNFFLVAVPLVVAAAPVRVAFVGNSYTYFNDLPKMFQEYSRHLKRPVDVHVASNTPGYDDVKQTIHS